MMDGMMGGMVVWTVVGVLQIVLSVVAILRLMRR